MPQMGANPRLADMRLALAYATEGSAPRPSEPCCTLAPPYQDSLSRREDSGTILCPKPHPPQIGASSAPDSLCVCEPWQRLSLTLTPIPNSIPNPHQRLVYRGLPMACLNLGGTNAVQFGGTGVFQRLLATTGSSQDTINV